MSKKKKKSATLAAEINTLREQIAALQAEIPSSTADHVPSPARPETKLEQSKGHGKSAKFTKSQLKAAEGQSLLPVLPGRADHPSGNYTPVYELKESKPVGFHATLLSEKDISQGRVSPIDGLFLDLFDRVRVQWLMHDWKSLAELDLDQISRHPKRSLIGLLAASASFQLGKFADAKELVAEAEGWGCDKALLTAFLAASAYLNIARAQALAGREVEAHRTLTKSVGGEFSGAPLDKLLSLYSLESSAPTEGALTKQPVPELASPDFAFLHAASTRFRRRKRFLSAAEKAKQLNANGESLFNAGQYKMAAEYFQRAINLQPRNAWVCQNLAEAVARLDSAQATQWECAELGDAIAAAGKWEIAVRYYRMALALSPETVEAHHSAQDFKLEPAREGHVDNPIFVVGCGHSGTSLMLAMLGSHPKLHPIPKETALFLRTDQAAQDAMSEFDTATRRSGKERWVEKTPPHIFQIHRFLAMRPGSRFVVILRDGRDVVCSLKERGGYSSIADRVERWVYDNMAADAYRQHPQATFVKYEDLVTDTENTLRQLCAFLGIEFTESLMHFHETPRRWYSDYVAKPEAITSPQEHNSHRNWQINQPLFDGRSRWQREMSEEEAAYFKASLAQDLLMRLGYAENADW